MNSAVCRLVLGDNLLKGASCKIRYIYIVDRWSTTVTSWWKTMILSRRMQLSEVAFEVLRSVAKMLTPSHSMGPRAFHHMTSDSWACSIITFTAWYDFEHGLRRLMTFEHQTCWHKGKQWCECVCVCSLVSFHGLTHAPRQCWSHVQAIGGSIGGW